MCDVLFVLGIKSNLLSLGQLFEKGYSMVMEDGHLKIFDKERRLLLKAPFSRDTTFEVDIEVLEHRCLLSAAIILEWVWHYRFGHLNFRDLHQLNTKGMVNGLPSGQWPKEVCEECLEGKQHTKAFKSMVGIKAKEK